MNFLKKFSLLFRKYQTQLILSALGIIFALFLLEISLRLFEKEGFGLSECTRTDRDFHHILIPNSDCRFKSEEWDVLNTINSQGLRDDEFSFEKGHKFRMLALGDSFLMGYGVAAQDSMTSVLEESLSASGYEVEIINSGVYSYSPMVEYLYLLKSGLKLNPDMVVQFFSATDFWEDRQRYSELAANNVHTSEQDLRNKIKDGVVEFESNEKNNNGSTVRKILKAIKSSVVDLKMIKIVLESFKKRDPIIQQDVSNHGNIDRDIAAILRGNKITDSDWEKLWDFPIFSLAMMQALLDSKNIQFMVVIIPEAVQVSEREWSGRSGLGFDSNFVDPRGDFQEELGKRLKNMNIEFVNLLPHFRQSKVFPLYFTKDGHFREAGHKLAAEILFEHFRRNDNLKK